ncbi:MAG TPA: LysE family translocator [Microlunatus sp.]
MIVAWSAVLGVALIAAAMACTPGPNMIFLSSRAIGQGRRAGLVALIGTAAGFGCYLVASSLGLSALFAAVPTAFIVLKIAGACYLGYLAWGMLRPGGRSPFAADATIRPHGTARLFVSGMVTNLLNPKIAIMYAALLPQFVSPERGPVWQQSLLLGGVQVVVAISINGLVVLGSGALAQFLRSRPRAMRIQRWLSGTLLGVFAVKLAVSHR